MKRLFCAIDIPLNDGIREVVSDYQAELSEEDIKWVDMYKLHITLKFFGDTPEAAIGPIAEALHLAAADTAPFGFTVEGCGTFGSHRQPRVIWLGVKKAQGMIHLYEKIQHHLLPLGYRPEQKLFTPHLTIGRIKELKDLFSLNNLESAFQGAFFNRIDVTGFKLYESKLHRAGPVYDVIQKFLLGEGHRA